MSDRITPQALKELLRGAGELALLDAPGTLIGIKGARSAHMERFVAALCAAGSPVTYLNVATARHRDTRSARFEASLAWMWALANGGPAPSTCAN